jgi:hypothetical protein
MSSREGRLQEVALASWPASGPLPTSTIGVNWNTSEVSHTAKKLLMLLPEFHSYK